MEEGIGCTAPCSLWYEEVAAWLRTTYGVDVVVEVVKLWEFQLPAPDGESFDPMELAAALEKFAVRIAAKRTSFVSIQSGLNSYGAKGLGEP